MDGSKIQRSAFSKKWHRKIGETLPKQLEGRVAPHGEKLKRPTTQADRAAFAKWVEESIRRWEEIKPEIAPHREKLKRLAAEADKLQAALKRIERIKVAVAKLGTDSGTKMSRNTAEGRLHLVADRAASNLSNLTTWNQLWRPETGLPPSFAVQLTKRLQDDFRLFCGHVRGFDGLLTVIRTEHPNLPELTISALEKQKQRARAKRKQRTK
jgi:hypothetical protein